MPTVPTAGPRYLSSPSPLIPTSSSMPSRIYAACRLKQLEGMRAKQLIDGASYGPEALKIVCHAFDDAWNDIAGNFGDDPGIIEAARLKLAHIILSFPHEKIRDAEQVKRSALQILALQYRTDTVSPPDGSRKG